MDWLSLPDLIELPNLLAQTPSLLPKPSPSPSPADIELLKSQLEFLKQSYSQFVDAVKIIFTILGIAGVIAAYFFGKSFKDFQDSARGEVQDATKSFKEFQEFARSDIKDFREFARTQVQDAIQRVQQEAEARIPHLIETEVGDLIRAEVSNVERTLRREQVIGSTFVDYYLPDGTSNQKEVELLRVRKFKQVQFFSDIQALSDTQSARRSLINVVVLDLINYTTPSGQAFQSAPEQERETAAQPLVDALLEFLPDSTVLKAEIDEAAWESL